MSAGRFRWLFVYGTLRPGGWNYRMLKPVIAMPPFEGATAKGAMFYAGGEREMYPVVDFDRDGTVTGTLLLVERESFEVQQVRRMEEGAGYEEVSVQVQIPNQHKTTLAVSYHFPVAPGSAEESAPVPGGDYVAAAREAGGEWPEVG